MRKIRWGVLASAAYADVGVLANKMSQTTQFVALANRDGGESRAHTDAYGVPKNFDTYEELLADDEVEAVFIALPPTRHAEWAVKALQAGKHVLCEKPLALAADDVERVYDAADAVGRMCVEGLMYRYHPQIRVVQDLVREGRIGKLMYVYAGLTAYVPEGNIRRLPELGGGALLDLGVFPVAVARLFGGYPERVYAEEVRRPGGADVSFAATLRFPDDVIAQFEVGQEVGRGDDLQIVGTTGRIIVKDPWLCRSTTVELSVQGTGPHGEPDSEFVPVDPDGVYGIEAPYAVARILFDTVSGAVESGTALPFGRRDAVEQARVIEALFESAAKAAPVELR